MIKAYNYSKLRINLRKMNTKTEDKNKLYNIHILTNKLLDCFLKHDGIAFGGVVRDISLRNSKIKELNTNGEYEYMDIFPEDIDVAVNKKNFENIMKELINTYYIKNIKNDSIKYVSGRNDLELRSYEILQVLSNSTYICMKVDFLIINIIHFNHINDYPPYSKKTLECDVNCLLMVRIHGIYISPKFTHNILKYDILLNNDSNLYLIKIFENIKNKEMEVFNDMDYYRLEKMIEKGWKMKILHTEIFIYDMNDDFNDLCTICLDKFKENDIKFKIKSNKCSCNIRYCLKCLNDFISKKIVKCPVCANLNDFGIEKGLNELQLLNAFCEQNKKSF